MNMNMAAAATVRTAMSEEAAAHTNSERSCFSCQFKWAVKYGLQIAPEGQSDVLRDGDIWHDMLEEYWHPRHGEWLPNDDCLIAAVTKLHDRFEPLLEDMTSGTVVNPSPSSYRKSDLTEAIARLSQGIVGYHRFNVRIGRKWSVILNEQNISTSLPDCDGSETGLKQAGKVDKVVHDEDGSIWIVEHKSTRMYLDSWVSRNGYKPQAPNYALLMRHKHRIEAVGVIFDLFHNKKPKSPEELPVTKAGALKKWSPSRLPATTAANWLKAMEQYDESEDWAYSVLSALKKRDESGYWFREERINFKESELQRTRKEIITVDRSIEEKERIISRYRDRVLSAHEDGGCWRTEAAKAMSIAGHMFPRNTNLCHMYNRPCPEMDFCKGLRPEGLNAHRLKTGRHEELGSDHLGNVNTNQEQ